MNTDIFNIIWRNLSDNLIPWFWRDITLFRKDTTERYWLREYVYCISNAMTNLTNRLFESAFDIQTKLTYSGQMEVLEICLNDYFDSADRRIFLSDDFTLTSDYFTLFFAGEPNPFPIDVYLVGEVDPTPLTFYVPRGGATDFYINVPTVLSYNLQRFLQIVNTYKLAGMRYIIQSF